MNRSFRYRYQSSRVEVPFKDDTVMPAYVARPAGKADTPGILVLQDQFGVCGRLRSKQSTSQERDVGRSNRRFRGGVRLASERRRIRRPYRRDGILHSSTAPMASLPIEDCDRLLF